MRQRIGVTGAAGMLGTALIDRLACEHEVFGADLEAGYSRENVAWDNFDLLDSTALLRWLGKVKPAVVVHCAAIVNVDACERRPEEAQALHAGTTGAIARTISEWNGSLYYISTDSVFDGLKQGPYREDDLPCPSNVYARTKFDGEMAALASGGTVLRTNIFGWSPSERVSFAEWVLRGLVEQARLTMFTDVVYTPIHVSHLADVIARLIPLRPPGLFHATGSSILSKYEFALKMAAAFELSASNIVACSVDDAGLSASRPKNMSLSNARLSTMTGGPLPMVDEGISLMREQYRNGWLSAVKGRPLRSGYQFWEN